MSMIYSTKDIDLYFFNEKFFEIGFESNYTNWFSNQIVTQYNSHGLFQKSKKEYQKFFNEIDNNNIIDLSNVQIDTEITDDFLD